MRSGPAIIIKDGQLRSSSQPRSTVSDVEEAPRIAEPCQLSDDGSASVASLVDLQRSLQLDRQREREEARDLIEDTSSNPLALDPEEDRELPAPASPAGAPAPTRVPDELCNFERLLALSGQAPLLQARPEQSTPPTSARKGKVALR